MFPGLLEQSMSPSCQLRIVMLSSVLGFVMLVTLRLNMYVYVRMHTCKYVFVYIGMYVC